MVTLSDCKHIHCIGIGGIGLSAIAEILLSRGYKVTGSDMKESDMTAKLAADGADIFVGHKAENVDGADLLVYSAAVAADNPELVRAKELGIPTASRAEILGLLMSEYENSIAVSGTHGKTTTTSMVSLILNNAKQDPTILVGGNLPEIGGNVKVGNSQNFVTEACEYMDSFLSLKPKIEIILNIDSDHLDYFRDIDHIASSFEKFASLVPEDGTIIAYDANPFVKSVVEGRTNVVTYGLTAGCDYYADEIGFDANGMPHFKVNNAAGTLCEVQLSVPGEHNMLNALAAFACCHIMGVDEQLIAETLGTFKGTQRRFDILGTTEKGVKIIDDYAHHPTEIKATLSAVKNIKHQTMWCLFQPHTYTRTLALFDEFVDSFADTDKLVLAEIYAAREKNIHKISSKGLADKIKEKYPQKDVYFFETLDQIADFVYENAEANDLVLTMGAGDIYLAGEKILEK